MVEAALVHGGPKLSTQVVTLDGVLAENACLVEGRVTFGTGAEEKGAPIGQDASLGASWARPVYEPMGA